MFEMRLRLLNALRLRTRAGLDDMPSLGVAVADRLGPKTLAVAIAALLERRKLLVGGLVHGDGDGEDGGDAEDEEGGDLHCDVGDVGVVVSVVVVSLCRSLLLVDGWE